MQSHPAPRRPGSTGIWTFLLIDMGVFGLFFLVYLSERLRVPQVFFDSRAHLQPVIGLLSTLLLLTSSWTLAEAVKAIREENGAKAGRCIAVGMVLGLLFVVNKGFEYSGKFAAGITPATNSFFGLYFVLTGIHLLHVLAGLMFMLSLRLRLARQGSAPAYLVTMENVGLFWHFVDILWLFIFALLYLAR